MKVAISKLHQDAIMPSKGSIDSAGFDLYAINDAQIDAFETKLIFTGWAFEIPSGYVGLIYARSGLATKEDLAPANKVGVIDADYRGEVMVSLHNHGKEKRFIKKAIVSLN